MRKEKGRSRNLEEKYEKLDFKSEMESSFGSCPDSNSLCWKSSAVIPEGLTGSGSAGYDGSQSVQW